MKTSQNGKIYRYEQSPPGQKAKNLKAWVGRIWFQAQSVCFG